ncbi:MAG: GxxExxY protein [Bacteroidales bacterium]|nr:GxxExxY protein [Bacteroidales bacterium]
MEFTLQGIPFEREKEMEILYKGRSISKKYRPDFICYNKIIVELKAVEELLPEFKAQTLNYMKMSNSKLGLLANYGRPSLEVQRLVRLQGW